MTIFVFSRVQLTFSDLCFLVDFFFHFRVDKIKMGAPTEDVALENEGYKPQQNQQTQGVEMYTQQQQFQPVNILIGHCSTDLTLTL